MNEQDQNLLVLSLTYEKKLKEAIEGVSKVKGELKFDYMPSE